MPAPKPADEVTLKPEQCATDSQMKEAGVTEQQLAKSNEPQFNDALAAKKEADAHTAAAPPAHRADEKSTLDQAKTDATGAAGAQAGAMRAGKLGALAQVAAQQGATKAKDEADRAKVAADLEAIYARTKADVTKILDGLEGKVTTAFDAGEKAAREAMENQIDDQTTSFKLKRYLLQPGGALLWVADQFSKPPELDAIVDAGVKLFLSRMDAVINQVADIVGAELTAARNRIAQGRNEIKQHVAALPKNLQKVGQEAASAIGGKFDQLDGEVDSKRDALVESLAQKYVTARDAANARAQEMRDANKGLWAKAKDAVNGVIETIKNLKSMLLGVLAKAAGVIDTIIEDPIKFLGNLVSAIKMGLNQFVGNIVQHLKKGLMGWLFGTLAEAGITLPESFDLKGILGLVLQILGLTYANIRARAVKVVGEKTISAIEKTVEVFTVLVKEGPAGLWKFIQDKLASLKETVMESIKDFVITKVITAGITWLISMLNPASAFIKACKMIYDVVMFFVERGSQIMGLVNAVLDGVGAIAAGSLGGAANLVEQALGKAIPVAIGFLASLLGLGGIAEKIKGVIEKIQKPINSMIDKLIGGVLKVAKKIGGAIKGLFGKGKGSPAEESKKLEAGVDAGVAAVNKYKGKKVGGLVLKPLLAGLRLRHGLSVLEPVKQDRAWAVHGELARMTKKTEVEEGDGGGDAWARIQRLHGQSMNDLAATKALLDEKDLGTDVKTEFRALTGEFQKRDADFKLPDAKDHADTLLPDFEKLAAATAALAAKAKDAAEKMDEEKLRKMFLDGAKTKHYDASAYRKHTRGVTNAERQENAVGGNGQFLVELNDGAIKAIERAGLQTGKIEKRSDSQYFIWYDAGQTVGYSGGPGRPTSAMRIEWSSGFVHSHPR
jgi:hypothetical protein